MNDKVLARLDKIMEFCVGAFVFTLPFSKSLVEVFFTLAFICWIVKRCIKYSPPVSTKLNLPIYVFTAIGFLSMLRSVSLPLSLEGFFFKLFEWVMIYFIVAEVINTREKINRILGVMLFSMGLIGINGVFQRVAGVDFIRGYSYYGRFVRSSFNNQNSFAGWLVVMIPLALSLAYFGRRDWFKFTDKYNWAKRLMKPALWILIGILMFCLASTHSRGAWIGALLSLIFIAIFKDKRLFALIIAALLILPFVIPDSMKKSATSLLSSEDINVNIRQELWREALSIIEDFPLLGSGLNTYAAVAPRYKVRKTTGFYPHNSYLQMAAESGLLGLGAFLWILIVLFWSSLAKLKKIDDKFQSAVLVGLLAGLFGFLAHSFVDVNFYTLKLGNFMWFVMGLIVAVQKTPEL